MTAAALAALLVYGFWPKPLDVDVVEVVAGPMRVTVDEDGKTRIKERYVITAPLSGQLMRIELEEGDRIESPAAVLASIDPQDPALLDARALSEAKARLSAAESSVQQALTEVERSQKAHELVDDDAERVRKLAATGAATQKELRDAELIAAMADRTRRSAGFAADVARYQLELAKAAITLTQPADNGGDQRDTERFEIHAPCAGQVLRVIRESAGYVAAGAELIEFGDPGDLEIVVDVLSTDAVKITPGDAVALERWGGEGDLHGVVRIVEPGAFTKISALGVEEQRVNVIVDFTDPLDGRKMLGDAYRVDARIVIWQHEAALKAPTSALFRRGDDWAVFVANDHHAELRIVKIGRRNDLEAQIVEGLVAGDRVIAHPGDRITDGVAIRPR